MTSFKFEANLHKIFEHVCLLLYNTKQYSIIRKFRYTSRLFTYFLLCMFIIPLASSGCSTPISSPFHSSALHSAPAASVLQALKFGTLSLQLSESAPAQLLPPLSKNWLSNILSSFLPVHPIQRQLTVVRVHKLYFLTYLLIPLTLRARTA